MFLSLIYNYFYITCKKITYNVPIMKWMTADCTMAEDIVGRAKAYVYLFTILLNMTILI